MVLLRAKECTVLIGSPLATVASTTTLFSQITGQVDYSGRVKSVEISGAEADTESVFLFGSDANGRQNAETEEQNMTEREFSGTLIYTDNVPMSLGSGTAVAVGSTGFTRAQGDGSRNTKAILLKFVDSAGTELHAIMNNARFTKLGDISLDAEGHAEQEVTAKCLAKDYYEDYKA